MANARPKSLNFPPNIFDETNTNNRTKTRSSASHDNSSSASSIDSNSIKNVNYNEPNSSSPNRLMSTTSSTTDSDFESEQDENNHSQRHKHETNSQDSFSRRIKHFHKLFKSEITDDMPELIDSYVCAYQGDILLQGKMYITNRYLCFHSRIINYVTKHVYRWEQIESVTKERVAYIFPTAIGIQLKHNGKKITYASFLQRDQAYEKILSIWTRATNEMSLSDDDDSVQDGTLKANRHDKGNHGKRDSYDIIDGEEEEVLQMCLKPNDSSNHKQRISSVSSKSSDEKQKAKKSANRNSNLDQKLTNDINENIPNTNQTTRHSRNTKNEQKNNDKSKRTSPVVNYRPQPTTSNRHKSRSRDRTSSPVDQTPSHSNSTLPSMPNINSSTPNTDHTRLPITILNIILSFLNLIMQNILSLFNYIRTYPIKITIMILLFITILFFHSFYLIKLANRIENRLQSLHHLIPSSSIKNSFSSNPKEL